MIHATIIIHAGLVGIATMIAIALAVAWREFDRPDHMRTWSVAFALSAVMWGIELVERIDVGPIRPPAVTTLAISGFASVVNTMAFRQRAGLPPLYSILFALAAFQAILVVVLRATVADPYASVVPIHVLNVAMFWVAASTLTGRRRGERIAERLAAVVLRLLALLSAGMALLIIAQLAGWMVVDLLALDMNGSIFLPATVSGIGFFTIFLLTADVADQTRRLAASDMLTGLLNRRGFEEAGEAILASARRHRRDIAVAVIDIDRFKPINDRFGHPAGDTVLREFARCLRENVARRDLVARTGGEEFAVVMADVDPEAAVCAADALRAKVAAMTIELDEPIGITVSIGIAALRPGEDLATVSARADRALYRSKVAGRDRVTLADESEEVPAMASTL